MKKIAVIEDQYFILETLKRFLTKEGYKVVTARNGYDGIKLLMADKPDLIIIDLNMPIMDGFKAIEIIKQDNSLKDIPVIILTAFADLDFVKKALKLGITDYVVKPYYQQDLLKRIEIALKKERDEKPVSKVKKEPPDKNKIKIGKFDLYKEIPVEEAKAGMSLAVDLRVNSQLVLLPAGTVLTDEIIEKLKKLKVKTVPIKIGGDKNE